MSYDHISHWRDADKWPLAKQECAINAIATTARGFDPTTTFPAAGIKNRDLHAERECRLVIDHVNVDLDIVQKNPAPALIVHSDWGTQYASAEHQALLAKHALVGSISRKGNCEVNDKTSAMMERFFLNLKMERVWQKDYANHAEAANDIADYIVGFYNCIRLHSTLGNLSPSKAFEREST